MVRGVLRAPLELLAEFARGQTGGAREQAAERRNILIADSIANLSHAEAGGFQQFACGIEALLFDPFAGAGLQFIEESPGQCTWRNPQMSRQIRQAQMS